LVNILRDSPMTHSPFQWILSLNWLCQNWGQVHSLPMGPAPLEARDGTYAVTPTYQDRSGARCFQHLSEMTPLVLVAAN
jgi:hypothetical protein